MSDGIELLNPYKVIYDTEKFTYIHYAPTNIYISGGTQNSWLYFNGEKKKEVNDYQTLSEVFAFF